TARLFAAPLGTRVAGEQDVAPFPMPSVRALAPRFRGPSLFYLSSRGGGDGLWNRTGERVAEIWEGADGALRRPAAISSDGSRVAIVTRKGGKRRLTIMGADGTDVKAIADGLDVQGTVDWSPAGDTLVAGGSDKDGPGLFRVPADGGTAVRLTKG